MNLKEARQESIVDLSLALKSISVTHPKTASRLFNAVTPLSTGDIEYFANASPKALREIAVLTDDLSFDDLNYFLSFIISRALLDDTEPAVLLDIRTAAVVTPLVGTVPVAYDHPLELLLDHTKRMNAAVTLLRAREMKVKSNTFKAVFQTMTGTRSKLSKSEKNLLRGDYMNSSCGELIPLNDREWFGANVEALVPLWSRFTSTGNFSRSYAEEVLSGAVEHGSALIDGFL